MSRFGSPSDTPRRACICKHLTLADSSVFKLIPDMLNREIPWYTAESVPARIKRLAGIEKHTRCYLMLSAWVPLSSPLRLCTLGQDVSPGFKPTRGAIQCSGYDTVE